MTKYNPKVGDTVTIPDSDALWLVLAPAGSKHRPMLCNCPANGTWYVSRHSNMCDSMQHFNRPATYWLQNADTGELYRPNGTDEAVHKSALTLVTAHSLPTKRELAQAELF